MTISLVAIGFLFGIVVGAFLPEFISLPRKRICTVKTDAEDATKAAQVSLGITGAINPGTFGVPLNGAETEDYAVTGTPRHVPWHIRKKELEAKSRTKRKQIEEFRSQA